MTSADNIQNLKKLFKLLAPNIQQLSNNQKNNFYKTKNLLFDSVSTNKKLLEESQITAEKPAFKELQEFRNSITDKNVAISGFIPTVLFEHFDTINKKNDNIIFQVLDPSISPQLRYVEDTDLFMNGIPTSIMSQCIPYFDIVFEFEDYLVTNTDKSVKRRINNEFNFFKSAEDAYSEKIKRFGMEYFTMPQTLNTDVLLSEFDKKDKNLNKNIPIDNYRPFIVLENFTIDSINPAGFFAFKNATATIKIVDKTRIKNFIQFFKGENFSKTTVYVTYGWVCPQNGNNPYADFINNKMLRRELYGVGNSAFSFESGNAVSINLNLFSKFSKELQNIPIGVDGVDIARAQLLQDISKKISESIGNLSEGQRTALFGVESITAENDDNLLAKKLLNSAEGGQSYIDVNFESILGIIADINELVSKVTDENSKKEIISIKRNLIGFLMSVFADSEDSLNQIVENVKNTEISLEGSLEKALMDALSKIDVYTGNINDYLNEIIDENENLNDFKNSIEDPQTISDFLKTRLASKVSDFFDQLSNNAENDQDNYFYIYLPFLLKSIENDEKRKNMVAKIAEKAPSNEVPPTQNPQISEDDNQTPQGQKIPNTTDDQETPTKTVSSPTIIKPNSSSSYSLIAAAKKYLENNKQNTTYLNNMVTHKYLNDSNNTAFKTNNKNKISIVGTAERAFNEDKLFYSALNELSNETGISISAMLSIFYVESGITAVAMNAQSVATGLYQLMWNNSWGTWNRDFINFYLPSSKKIGEMKNLKSSQNRKDYANKLSRTDQLFSYEFYLKSTKHNIYSQMIKYKGKYFSSGILVNDALACVANTGGHIPLATNPPTNDIVNNVNDNTVIYEFVKSRAAPAGSNKYMTNGKQATVKIGGEIWPVWKGGSAKSSHSYWGISGCDKDGDAKITVKEIYSKYLSFQKHFKTFDQKYKPR